METEKDKAEQVVTTAKKKIDDSSKKTADIKASSKPSADPKASAKPTAKAVAKVTPKPVTKPASKTNKAVASNNQPAKQKSCHVVNHPAVTHQVPVYQTVHHDEVSHMENYVVKPAWDEQVINGAVYVCNDCGQKFNTAGELEDHADIIHDNAANYHTEPVYQTVHHDAVMGQRKVVDQAAYDETVQTGTKTVTDKKAYSENVCN